jgi:hypothetical protein
MGPAGAYAGPAPDPKDELEALKDDAAGLEETLKDIRARISELESKK